MPRCSAPECFERGNPADYQIVRKYEVEPYSYQGANGNVFAPGICIGLFLTMVFVVGLAHFLGDWARRKW